MTEKRLAACQRVIGYYFSNPRLLETALTHSSLRAPDRECNERLEFLGDSILGLVITEELYHLLPDQSEGELTRIKSAVVSRSALLDASLRLGLPQYAEFARGVGKRDHLPASVVANLVESVIGAIYLDAGYYPAREFVLRHLGTAIDDELHDRGAKNYKSLLQHEVQQSVGVTPTYRTLEAEGPDHAKEFVVAAVIHGREWGRATGTTKKDAEQEAARKALEAWQRRGRGRRRRRRRRGNGHGEPAAAPIRVVEDEPEVEVHIPVGEPPEVEDVEVAVRAPAPEPESEPEAAAADESPTPRRRAPRRRRGSAAAKGRTVGAEPDAEPPPPPPPTKRAASWPTPSHPRPEASEPAEPAERALSKRAERRARSARPSEARESKSRRATPPPSESASEPAPKQKPAPEPRPTPKRAPAPEPRPAPKPSPATPKPKPAAPKSKSGFAAGIDVEPGSTPARAPASQPAVKVKAPARRSAPAVPPPDEEDEGGFTAGILGD